MFIVKISEHGFLYTTVVRTLRVFPNTREYRRTLPFSFRFLRYSWQHCIVSRSCNYPQLLYFHGSLMNSHPLHFLFACLIVCFLLYLLNFRQNFDRYVDVHAHVNFFLTCKCVCILSYFFAILKLCYYL